MPTGPLHRKFAGGLWIRGEQIEEQVGDFTEFALKQNGFRPMEMDDARHRLFGLIRQTPHLDWLLLTKRPSVARDYLQSMYENVTRPERAGGEEPLKNVWVGTSIENQTALERIMPLRESPAVVRFISFEPLLEDLGTIRGYLEQLTGGGDGAWAIIGCESGPRRRPCELEWVRAIVGECRSVGYKVFIKQLSIGGKVVKNIDQFPADLQVRDFPDAQKEKTDEQ